MDKRQEPTASIRFKPMTEGLGLNHFADGLPYTPAQAKRTNLSSSASRTAASLSQAPVGTDTARRMIEQFERDLHPAQNEEKDPAVAGCIRRVAAYGFDIVFSTAMFGLIVWASFSLNGFDLEQLLSERRGVQIFWPLALLYAVVHMGYFLIQETTWRRTLGKAVMGIRIRSSSGFSTLGRAVCFFIAALPFGVGLIWYFFDSRHRCWHDVITDCEVVLN